MEFIHPFPPDAEGNTGGRAQVTLVGGVDENLSFVFFETAGFPVQDDDFIDVPVRHRYPGRITVELAHRPDLDAGAFRQHLVKDFRCDAGFEMITGRAIFHLLGVGPVSTDIIRLDPVDKLEEQACRRAPGRDVGRPETVGRQAADVVRPFQKEYRLSHAGGGNCRHNASWCASDDDDVIRTYTGRGKDQNDPKKPFKYHEVYGYWCCSGIRTVAISTKTLLGYSKNSQIFCSNKLFEQKLVINPLRRVVDDVAGAEVKGDGLVGSDGDEAISAGHIVGERCRLDDGRDIIAIGLHIVQRAQVVVEIAADCPQIKSKA